MKMMKHKGGIWIPRRDHDDVTTDDVYRSLLKFNRTLEKYIGGSGQHPHAEQIADLQPHLRKLWQIVVDMDHNPVETENVAPAAYAKWLKSQRKAQTKAAQ